MRPSLADARNFAAKLTPRRLANMARVWGSYHYAKSTGKPVHWGLPIALSFEPTTACNLRCPECPSGLRSFTRPTGTLTDTLYQQVIDELAPTLSYLIFYFQGEPYIHPRFLDLVNYASEKGIYTATSTNAHFLSDKTAERTVKSGLDRLIVSIDGTTQDTYASYRKEGDLQKVIEGTRRVIAWKKRLRSATPHVIFQFLVVRPNEHQIPEVYRLADELGVDAVGLKTAQIYDYEEGSDLIPTIDKYARYRQRPDGRWEIKNSLAHSCWKMWHSCVITWDGKVVPCCFDKDAHYQLGDVQQTSFAELWHGEAYRHFRRLLLGSRSNIEMCKNCTEGTKVWA